MDTTSVTRVSRPGIVTAIVVLYVINALFALPVALLLLTSGNPGIAIPAVLMITTSVLILIFAVGLWMLRRWARVMALVVSVLLVPFSAFGLVSSGGRDPGTYLGVVAAVLALYGLTRERVRSVFS